MRVIAGIYKGYVFKPFKADHTRPTTDLAKEAVFNVLLNRFDTEGSSVLDLFAGTGNMSLEFLSRGAAAVCSVDHHVKNLQYMQAVKKELDIAAWQIQKADVVKFCKQASLGYDLIFADPPYDWPGMHPLVQQILDSQILNADGIFIMEHPKNVSFARPELIMRKEYGISCFSFFQKTIK